MGSGNLRGAGLRARCVFRERVTLIHCVIHARMRVGAARVRAANDGSHLPTTSHLRLDLRPGIQVMGGCFNASGPLAVPVLTLYDRPLGDAQTSLKRAALAARKV